MHLAAGSGKTLAFLLPIIMAIQAQKYAEGRAALLEDPLAKSAAEAAAAPRADPAHLVKQADSGAAHSQLYFILSLRCLIINAIALRERQSEWSQSRAFGACYMPICTSYVSTLTHIYLYTLSIDVRMQRQGHRAACGRWC